MKVYKTTFENLESSILPSSSIIISVIEGWLVEWKKEFQRKPNKAIIIAGLKLLSSLETDIKVKDISTISQYLVLSLYDLSIRIIPSWEIELYTMELSLE
jgi:hypothetical protein